MAATMMFLSPATRRISPGSLVTTVIWPVDADWMTAPMCESATETPIRSRMPAAVLALTVFSGQSAIRRRFGKTRAGRPGLSRPQCGLPAHLLTRIGDSDCARWG